MMILLKNLNVYVFIKQFQLLPQQDLKMFFKPLSAMATEVITFFIYQFSNKMFYLQVWRMQFFKPNSCKYITFIKVQQFKQQSQQQKENRENQKHQICFTT